MASTYSTDLKIELMVTGENAGTWGTKTNTNLNLIQQAIAGYEAISIAGGAQTTALAMTNATISNARNAVVKLTGTITGNQIVTIPDGIEKTYIIENGTTGAFTVQFKTVSGTGPTFSTTDKGIKIVYSNGTNIVDVNANLSGPTLASDLNVNGKSIISSSNGNIVLAPDGTGDVYLDADTVRVGDANTAATLTTNGTGNLTINTNAGTNSGTITINQGANGNIAITPNGTGSVVLDGLNWPQADGTNGQVIQTNGSGQLSFATSGGSVSQLVKDFAFGTGVTSVTAARAVLLNSSGQIGSNPVANTYGTARTNSSNLTYTAISTDGSRAVNITTSFSGFGGGSNGVLTINGRAISNTADPTNGAQTTQTWNSQYPGQISGAGASAFLTIYPAGTDRFFLFYGSFGSCPAFNCNPPVYYGNCYVQYITVNSSGTVTKGAVTTVFAANQNDTDFNSKIYNCGKIHNNLYVINFTAGTNNVFKRIYTSSDGSTTITSTTDTDANDWTSCNGTNSQLTTNNILGYGFNGTWRTATYTPSPIGIGAYTDTTAISDYLSGATWTMMKATSTNNADYIIVTYTDTNGIYKYKTFSVNQTTGALTLVETGNVSTLVGWTTTIVFKDKDNFVNSSAISYSFTNGVFNGYNSQNYSPTASLGLRYNSGDLFYVFYTNPSNYPVNIGYTVNAYASNPVTGYIGIVKTTTSSSPATIVLEGVASGFSGLTINSNYYATAPFDGTVTTSTASNIGIGRAISTTEILLNRYV